MKIKITKGTIETVLWLLGQLITLMKQISKDNKDNEFGEVFTQASNVFLNAKCDFLTLKITKKRKDYGKEKDKENTKGN